MLLSKCITILYHEAGLSEYLSQSKSKSLPSEARITNQKIHVHLEHQNGKSISHTFQTPLRKQEFLNLRFKPNTFAKERRKIAKVLRELTNGPICPQTNSRRSPFFISKIFTEWLAPLLVIKRQRTQASVQPYLRVAEQQQLLYHCTNSSKIIFITRCFTQSFSCATHNTKNTCHRTPTMAFDCLTSLTEIIFPTPRLRMARVYKTFD